MSEQLTELGIHKDIHQGWVTHIGDFRFLRNHVARWNGNVGDKAEIVLKLNGRPMSREEITAEIGEDHNERTLGNRLVSDTRFCRTGPDQFALKKWGLEEYSSIIDEVLAEIAKGGGEASADYLTSTISSKFGVSVVSVRTYLASPRFVRTARGTVRARAEEESFTASRKIELTRRCYRLAAGWAYRITVDDELLRGSGRPLPSAFAVHMGLVPLRTLTLSSDKGEVRVGWPSQQPTIGSLRSAVESLGGLVGDYIFVAFVPASKLQFTLITRALVDRVNGLERLQAEICGNAVADGANQLESVAYALGLERTASLHAIRRRLEMRSEVDLLGLLPSVSDADESAIRELLELVGGEG